jgi:hypothetical protein
MLLDLIIVIMFVDECEMQSSQANVHAVNRKNDLHILSTVGTDNIRSREVQVLASEEVNITNGNKMDGYAVQVVTRISNPF